MTLALLIMVFVLSWLYPSGLIAGLEVDILPSCNVYFAGWVLSIGLSLLGS